MLKAGSCSELAAKMIRQRARLGTDANCGNCDIVHAEASLAKIRAAREKREQAAWAKERANSIGRIEAEE